MEKKVLAGLIVIAAIVLVAIFTGCVEYESQSPPPLSFQEIVEEEL